MSFAKGKQLSLTIKTRLFILIAIVLIFSLFSIVLLHFNLFSSKLSYTKATTIPTLVHSTTLAYQSSWLRDQMEQAIATTNPLIQYSILTKVSNYKEYELQLNELRAVQANPQLLQGLEKEFHTLKQQTIAIITTKITLSEQLEQISNIGKRLYILLPRIANNHRKTIVDKQLSAICTVAIIHMLSLTQEEEPWVVDSISKLAMSSILEGEKLEQQASKDVGQIYREIRRLLTLQTGLIARKKENLNLKVKFTKLHARTAFMGAIIVQSCTNIRENTEKNLQKTQNETIIHFSQVQNTTFAFLGILLLVFIGVYIFLQRNVLVPIQKLTSAIENGTTIIKAGHEYNIPLPLAGELEICAISRSTTYFFNEIMAQREALSQSHRHLEKLVRKRTMHITTLSGKLIHAQETEGKRIAAELHDDIGATLSVIKMSIEYNTRILQNSVVPLDELQISLTKQKALIGQVTAQLRRIQTDLSPPYLALGLREGLKILCEDYIMLHDNIVFNYAFRAKGIDIPTELHVVIYRILQEGLTNIVKHSQCSEARIGLFLSDTGLTFSIEDNGIPFPSASSPGMGLKNIEERVLVSNGSICYQQEGAWKGPIITWDIFYTDS